MTSLEVVDHEKLGFSRERPRWQIDWLVGCFFFGFWYCLVDSWTVYVWPNSMKFHEFWNFRNLGFIQAWKNAKSGSYKVTSRAYKSGSCFLVLIESCCLVLVLCLFHCLGDFHLNFHEKTWKVSSEQKYDGCREIV